MASVFSDDGSLDASLPPVEAHAYGDATRERMMTMDELKQEMFKSLKDSGTIEAIRAQLRRRFIEKLKKHGRKAAREMGSDSNNDGDDDEERGKWSVDERLVHGLIHEYLQHHAMEHTMAVFVPEVGGPQHLLSGDAIVQMLRLPESPYLLGAEDNNSTTPSARISPPPLVTVLVKELARRLSVSTMSSGSQTAMDLHDHRLALENQLRRVETTYLAECASHKKDHSATSFEERALRYQREYDELCEKRMKEDLERFKTTELALMRVEERKKFERELETVKVSMFQEHRVRLQRLQDRERELEMAFAAKKAELETSLFEARQHIFQDIEKLRVKTQEVEAKYNSETRQLTIEARRLQLLEENLKVREENMQSAVDGIIREKEKAWQLEKLQRESDAKAREQQLLVREHALGDGQKRFEQEKDAMKDLRKEMANIESELINSQTALATTEKKLGKLDAEKKALEREVAAREELLSEDKHNMKSLSYENARLAAELKVAQAERPKLEGLIVERSSHVKQVETEMKELQRQLLTIKLNEANEIVEERKKLMHILECEREDARWKENELVGRLRELQSRLAESEATAEKYQTQYEDEKVHVETLRHEVGSLHTLLAQSQSTVTMRHQSGGRNLSSLRSHTGAEPASETSERMMMKMMEMMSQIASIQGAEGFGNQRVTSLPTQIVQPASARDPNQLQNCTVVKKEEEEEAAKLKQEQQHMERELLEQREFQRKKRERDEAELQEMDQRRREFQDQLEQERVQRAQQDQAMEEDRRRRAAEQEARLQEELGKQMKALDDAREAQKKLIDEHIAAEQARLQQERAREDERARIAKEEAELAALRLQRLREQREEEEREQERRQNEIAFASEEKELPQARTQSATEKEETRAETTAVLSSELVGVVKAEERVGSDEGEAFVGGHASDGHDGVLEAPTETIASKRRDTLLQEVSRFEDLQSDHENYHSDHDDRNENERQVEQPDQSNHEPPLDDRCAIPNCSSAVEESQENYAGRLDDSAGDQGKAEYKEEVAAPSPVKKSDEELEEERRKVAEEAKKKEDEDALDAYRQRVLARRAAEKQSKRELEEQRKREEEERTAAELARQQEDDSEDDMEKSGGSFASSAASSSGSF